MLDCLKSLNVVTQSKKQRTVSVFGSGKGYVPKTAKEAELAAMFKPPTDIAFHGGLDEAKEYAASMDRWLIVNIQDETEFASHVLNRDFWSSEGIRSLLAFSFVLWQQLNFSSEGILFIERYKVVSFPCIAILDPVTGACVLKLEGRDKMKPASLVERSKLSRRFLACLLSSGDAVAVYNRCHFIFPHRIIAVLPIFVSSRLSGRTFFSIRAKGVHGKATRSIHCSPQAK